MIQKNIYYMYLAINNFFPSLCLIAKNRIKIKDQHKNQRSVKLIHCICIFLNF